MRHLQEDAQSSHVTALFADRAVSFALDKGATLKDLAFRLTFLDGREPLAVIVNLGIESEVTLGVHSEPQSTVAIAVLPP